MISIIIPLYNVEQYVAECLDSVLQQTYKDIEIVLIDDCCSDNTISVVESFLASHNVLNYKLIHHRNNSGLSAARNTGLDNAQGDYVYFLDSDDFLAPDAIGNLYNAINEDPSYGIAISYFTSYIEGKGPRIYSESWLFAEKRIIEPEDYCYRMLTEKSNFASTAKLYRKSVIGDIRFQLGKRNEDTLFIVDLTPQIEKNKIRCIDIPDYSYYYRMRTGSITHNQQVPLECSVIDNYDYALIRCAEKLDVVEWLSQRQLQLSVNLAKKCLCSRALCKKYYKMALQRIKSFSRNLARESLSKDDYIIYLRLLYAPTLYKFYKYIRGRLI